jgi:ubiquinone/menaquinone biosynthesis C-methylase UbiE
MNLKKQIKETYEKEAKSYDKTRVWFEYSRFAYRERKLLSKFLKRRSKILFLACGTGRHIKFVINQLDSEVFGIDLAANMIKVAERKLSKAEKDRVHFIVSDAEHLPFRENVFDGVVCSRAFYLFINKFKVLQEVYNVLKNGGAVIK